MTDTRVNTNEQINEKKEERLQMLTSPDAFIRDYPCSIELQRFVTEKRKLISDVVNGIDDRLLVVIGPCSIHNIEEGLEYANKLSEIGKTLESTLVIVMRVYLEKPRTTVGWKGLIYDPFLDGSCDIDKGLQVSRQLLLTINQMGLPCATELLQPMLVHYIADLVSWSAIGARTTESQIHRELVSGLQMAVGFKNGTTGCIKAAVNACVSSQMAQPSFSIDQSGKLIAFHTNGNPDVHVVLRGGTLSGPNYSQEHIRLTQKLLNESRLKSRIMVDCSHGNSLQDCERQIEVIGDICQQVSDGDQSIMGVMIESNLCGGRQVFVEGKKHLLKYGTSITDTCISWDDTHAQLLRLSQAVLQRRLRIQLNQN